MFAVIEACGKQYRVEPGMRLRVDRLSAEEGAEIDLGKVLLVSGDALSIGAPVVEGATVRARVLGHPKGDKVHTMKFRRRHRTRRRVGFRHSHTDLEILDIQLA
jgi:large subunit ribosomal protein L21